MPKVDEPPAYPACFTDGRGVPGMGESALRRPKVLVVEDEENVRRLIDAYLQHEGFDVVGASDGAEALQLLGQTSPDVVILDVMLPKVDGWEVCRRIRDQSRIPVIMLSARGAEQDRIKGLEYGADDYITKPFSPKELVLRVRAVLRRARPVASVGERAVLRYPGLEIDRRSRRCTAAGRVVELTRREFDLLWHLARHPGRAFERESLLQQVWGYDFHGDARTIDVHVTRLREKLEDTGSYKYLHTVWGVGYKFDVLAPDGTEVDSSDRPATVPGGEQE